MQTDVYFGFIPAIAITLTSIAKEMKMKREYLPIVSALSGVIASVGMYLDHAPYFPASNLTQAVILGIMAGAGGTGFHQIVKQLTNRKG